MVVERMVVEQTRNWSDEDGWTNEMVACVDRFIHRRGTARGGGALNLTESDTVDGGGPWGRLPD